MILIEKIWGEIIECEKYATYIHKTTGRCNSESLYTHQLSDSKEQVLIGTNEYIPVCVRHAGIN